MINQSFIRSSKFLIKFYLFYVLASFLILAKFVLLKSSTMKIDATPATTFIDIKSAKAAKGLMPHRISPIIPKTAPQNYPVIRRIPLVKAGAIGNVNSAPRPIDAGITGTIVIPKKHIQTEVNEKSPIGRMIAHMMSIAITPKQTTLIVRRYLEVF